jgi:23S rRNA-/tRNA-specific pseudouridylate synthase
MRKPSSAQGKNSPQKEVRGGPKDRKSPSRDMAPRKKNRAMAKKSAVVEKVESGPTEKAYKLLALQEGISNRDAKELIDRGVVYAMGKKVIIARAEIKAGISFRVERPARPVVIFEDDDIMAVDKPPFVESDEVVKEFGFPLINRLDKETSGVILMAKNEDFRQKAITAFRKKEVYKEYIALVEGVVAEPFIIDTPIKTIKGTKARSEVALGGVKALTEVEPISFAGGKSKVKVVIHTGRTHQIRVHLSSKKFPIIGDTQYGGKPSHRMMLHSYKTELLGYTFEAYEPALFANFG